MAKNVIFLRFELITRPQKVTDIANLKKKFQMVRGVMRNILKMLIGVYRGFLSSFGYKNAIFLDFHLIRDPRKSPINQIVRKKIFPDGLWNNGEHF